MKRLYIPFVLLFFIIIFIALEAGALRLWLEIPGTNVPSKNIDCDDVAIKTYRQLSRIGVRAEIRLWFAYEKKEPWSQENNDHIWIVAEGPLGINIPLDYGIPKFESKFFLGTPVTEEQLLEFVQNDFEKQ